MWMAKRWGSNWHLVRAEAETREGKALICLCGWSAKVAYPATWREFTPWRGCQKCSGRVHPNERNRLVEAAAQHVRAQRKKRSGSRPVPPRVGAVVMPGALPLVRLRRPTCPPVRTKARPSRTRPPTSRFPTLPLAAPVLAAFLILTGSLDTHGELREALGVSAESIEVAVGLVEHRWHAIGALASVLLASPNDLSYADCLAVVVETPGWIED